MPPVKREEVVLIDQKVTVEGFGRASTVHSATVLRKDEDFLIVRMKDRNNQPADRRFHLNGILAGSNEAVGYRIKADDLKIINQSYGAPSGNNAANEPFTEEPKMAAKTMEKEEKTKLTVVAGGKAAAAKAEKNGHKPAPEKAAVKAKPKAKPAVEDEEEEEAPKTARKATAKAKSAVPEAAPSPKKGQAVKRAAKPVEDEEEEAPVKRGRKPAAAAEVPVKKVMPKITAGKNQAIAAAKAAEPAAKRGRKAIYTIPVPARGEILLEMSQGAYDSITEECLPSTKSKKTTDIEKEFVKRWKDGYLFKKVYVLLNKPTAEVFLTITEAAADLWSDLGVAGSHFARATTREADKVRETFRLKGGIRFEPATARTPAPKEAPKPAAKAVSKPSVTKAKVKVPVKPAAPAAKPTVKTKAKVTAKPAGKR